MEKKAIELLFAITLLNISCTDYVKLSDNSSVKYDNFRPSIDFKHISPYPSRFGEIVSLGTNCVGQSFKIPPITDKDLNDRLYYLWFFDNKLVGPESIIEPELRSKDPIVLNIDGNFLDNHFGAKIPKDFFTSPHIIEFFVSDKPYTIPESRYINETEEEERNHSDYFHWTTWFSNDSC